MPPRSRTWSRQIDKEIHEAVGRPTPLEVEKLPLYAINYDVYCKWHIVTEEDMQIIANILQKRAQKSLTSSRASAKESFTPAMRMYSNCILRVPDRRGYARQAASNSFRGHCLLAGTISSLSSSVTLASDKRNRKEEKA